MDKCERCGTNEVKIILKDGATSKRLCNNCYNEIMSDELGVDLEQLIESFSLKDYQGVSRTFYVERRLHPVGLYLEAAEDIKYGYKFAIHGELDSNQTELLTKLIEKTRKGIHMQQVKSKLFPNGQAYNSIIHDQFTGIIEYDESSDGVPLIIIDGKPFAWEEVGKMLMTYEGFQIKVKMYDVTDDVD
ncbi:hypothetical protein RRV45_20270 [Bacillus sp. DTU_2020_1000418_1_SI_GHA_SEK_038]|uniref:DUF7713 domain-containing protein n=1 Tax=Bacillus sp. DTU_2020_1000418_1_SI_GHA_SEK_038 TaxID=3077585 RepID=UPI0028E6B4DF|nr:hypothetical protein [Bacillus sp. DTU_2020_1000418_1_SI_GHA_SEK_038]WNS75183.1 hypothetical protein RRV45_20270 [Bacillus sp. DTU_2020_1000418_1_SI_GHA_SEK_038]